MFIQKKKRTTKKYPNIPYIITTLNIILAGKKNVEPDVQMTKILLQKIQTSGKKTV